MKLLRFIKGMLLSRRAKLQRNALLNAPSTQSVVPEDFSTSLRAPTDHQPPSFATGGHPGCSQLATEIDRRQFEEILQVGHNRFFRKLA